MARKLTAHFLAALKVEFPFLKEWDPELHSAYRPIEFRVQRELPANTIWKLELGRHNNRPDGSYHSGVTIVFISNGTDLKKVRIDEGETRPEDILLDDTKFVLVKDSWRNQLVHNDPGSATYIFFKRAQTTLAAVKEDVARAAQAMRAELES